MIRKLSWVAGISMWTFSHRRHFKLQSRRMSSNYTIYFVWIELRNYLFLLPNMVVSNQLYPWLHSSIHDGLPLQKYPIMLERRYVNKAMIALVFIKRYHFLTFTRKTCNLPKHKHNKHNLVVVRNCLIARAYVYPLYYMN